MFSCLGCKNKHAICLPIYLSGAALPFIAKLANGATAMLPLMCAVMVLLALYLFFIAVIFNKKYTVVDISMCYITSIYIIGGFTSIIFLRNLSEYTYLLVFVGAWVTDIFAYFTGRFLGKHKLCEAISPKKTIEGSIGGIVFCIISFVVFGFIVWGTNKPIEAYLALGAVGLIVSIVSQIGDLSMSLIKRHYKVKDFGKLFPGHGGVLDRFDSVIAVSTVLFIMISALKMLNIDITI